MRRETETKRQQREAETEQALRESHNWAEGEAREAEEDTDRERQRPRREGHRRKFWRREVLRRISRAQGLFSSSSLNIPSPSKNFASDFGTNPSPSGFNEEFSIVRVGRI